MNKNKNIDFSLGYNFDQVLIDKVVELNEIYDKYRRVNEFFGALPNGPFLSTRPQKRIWNTSWQEFKFQIEKMSDSNINFNYLLNAKTEVNEIDLHLFSDFLNKLYDVGVSYLIAYSPELCKVIKSINQRFHVTISSVYNIRTKEQIDEAYNSGADFIYIDSIFINRNFELLRKLHENSKIPLKLYANVCCLSQCPNKDLHYSVLSNPDNDYQVEMNDKLFNYCSSEKLKNPVNWLQMQWIRPEDIDVYVQEGFNHFKLTDRLAPTDTLVFIAEHYLKGESPSDLFPLIERNGTKFKYLSNYKIGNQNPFFIDNSMIPNDFIEHFRSGECYSTNIDCDYCNKITKNAIRINNQYVDQKEVLNELHSYE